MSFLGVSTKEGMTWLILDSGAGGVSLISRDYATLFGLEPQGKEQRLKYEVAPVFQSTVRSWSPI
jgi:hypothetical protein